MLRICVFLTVLLYGSFLQAQQSEFGEAIQSAESLFSDFAESNNIPGTAVAVMVGGELVWSKGLGYASVAHEVAVDPNRTLFRIGSVSKPFTAAALGVLYEEGKIDLDIPIQEYVPEFPEKDYPITLRQIAGHVAGIRHYQGQEFLSTTYYATVTEGLSIFSGDDLLFEPETKYMYSSYGWNLISAAIEGASGKPFLTFMSDYVFDPLGMAHTSADYANRIIPHRTDFYVRDKALGYIPAPYVDNSYKWAGGGFVASAEDVARFGHAHLTEQLLDYATIQEWIMPQTLKNGESTGYGIGWVSGEDDQGNQWFGHSGGSVGGITQLIIFPEKSVVVAMLTNISPVNYKSTHLKIAQCFMR